MHAYNQKCGYKIDSVSKVQPPPRIHNMHQCICLVFKIYRHAYAQSAHTH
jgi:hypothetical protein